MIGKLEDQTIKDIRDRLPNLPTDWLDITFPEQFSFKISDLDNDETTHISLVCLYDAFRRSESALDCLFECYAHIAWYRKEKEDIATESREFFAVRQGKFYAEYNFLFLYAIGEDIADFVLNFLTKSGEFKSWLTIKSNQNLINKKKIFSKAAKVGVFMAREYSNHEITEIILRLSKNEYWQKAIKFRNTWVHDKPPILEGLGIEYDRKNKIWSDGKAKGFGLGVWSNPDFKIDDVVVIAHEATTACILTLADLLLIVKDKRDQLGTPVL